MLKRKLTTGSPLLCWSKSGLRVREILALDHHLLLDAELAFLFDLIELLDFRRILAGIGDEAEFELRGLAEDFLERFGVLKARHLHQHAVVALTLDARLARAEGVDAPPNDFDRLLDGLARLVRDARVGDGHADEAVRRRLDVERRRPAHESAAEAVAQLPQFRKDFLSIRRVGDAHLHAARGRSDAAGDGDLFFAQDSAHVVAQIFHLRADEIRLIHFERHMRAALQVEAEHDGRRRKPGGQARLQLFIMGRRQHARRDDKHRSDSHRHNGEKFPGRESQHCPAIG